MYIFLHLVSKLAVQANEIKTQSSGTIFMEGNLCAAQATAAHTYLCVTFGRCQPTTAGSGSTLCIRGIASLHPSSWLKKEKKKVRGAYTDLATVITFYYVVLT